jgi:hypothetical protein
LLIICLPFWVKPNPMFVAWFDKPITQFNLRDVVSLIIIARVAFLVRL